MSSCQFYTNNSQQHQSGQEVFSWDTLSWVWPKYSPCWWGKCLKSPETVSIWDTWGEAFQWPNIQVYSVLIGFYGLYHNQSWILSLSLVFEHKNGIWPCKCYFTPESGIWFFENGIWPGSLICMIGIWLWEWWTHWHQSGRLKFGWNITSGPQILIVEGESVWNLSELNEGDFRQIFPETVRI